MSNPERINCPSIVILHDTDHDNFDALTEGLALQRPYEIIRYVDGAANATLEDEAASANHVLIQNSLLNPPTPDAIHAVRAAWFRGVGRTGLMAFGEDYKPEAEPLGTMLKELAQEEVAI